jgi:WD40 repeat protein
MGVGTSSPIAKLHVSGNSGEFRTSTAADPYNHLGLVSYLSYWYSSVGRSGQNFGGVSIYASDDIFSALAIGSFTGFITASDSRIKKEIVDVEDGAALETLRLLKPKKYKYKDEVRRGTEPVWGFIAQEVRDTLPYATQLRTDCLPNIYELANVSNSNVITFTNFDTSNLESNAMVLKVFDVDDAEHLVNITEVVDDHSVRVDEDLTEWIGTVEGSEGDKIFVYGQQVDDFVFLKKDAIWTVATAALQEVDRQLQAEKEKVASLEERLAALEAIVLNQ